MKILGVTVQPVTFGQAVDSVRLMLHEGGQHVITTPNPEIVMAGYRNSAYQDVLNKADLAIPDGAGLLLASKWLGEPLPERVSGTDLLPEIFRLAQEAGAKVALIGGRSQEVIERAAREINKKFPQLKIVFADYGVSPGDWAKPEEHEKIIARLEELQPEVVIVALGHPKQEQWIDQNRARLPQTRIFMGVGGALDFIAGSSRRAPQWMRTLWLEWLWRLLTDPKRIKRILTATVIFPLTVMYDRIRQKS